VVGEEKAIAGRGPFDDDFTVLVAGQSQRSRDSYIWRSRFSTQAMGFTSLSTTAGRQGELRATAVP
jgi:hypothetical protein